MTYSRTFGKETQPQDYLISVAKRLTKIQINSSKVDLFAKTKEELTDAIASHVVKFNTTRVEEEHSMLFRVECFVIPADDFMGLVVDMAKAMIEEMKDSDTAELQDQQQQTQALIKGIDV